jgi:hypothetical protein
MIEEQRGLHFFAELRRRVVGDTAVLLFEHDVALRQHRVIGQLETGHAIGFEFHHHLQTVASDALEVAGIIGRGERILLSAESGQDLGEAAGRILLGTLEHQMLEEMRDAGFTRRLVGGADAIPDHMGDDRRAAVGNHDDFHPVRELGMRDFGSGSGGAGCDTQKQRCGRGRTGCQKRSSADHECSHKRRLLAAQAASVPNPKSASFSACSRADFGFEGH